MCSTIYVARCTWPLLEAHIWRKASVEMISIPLTMSAWCTFIFQRVGQCGECIKIRSDKIRKREFIVAASNLDADVVADQPGWEGCLFPRPQLPSFITLFILKCSSSSEAPQVQVQVQLLKWSASWGYSQMHHQMCNMQRLVHLLICRKSHQPSASS